MVRRAGDDAPLPLSNSRVSKRFHKEKCLAISPDKPNVLLLGDSHAAQYALALRHEFPDTNILQATSSACRPVLPVGGDQKCRDLLNFIFNKFLTGTHLDAIILAGRWSEDEVRDLPGTIEYLHRLTPDVIVMGPTAEYRTDLPRILVTLESQGETDPRRGAYQFLDMSRYPVSDAVNSAAGRSGAQFVDVLGTLCDPKSCRVLSDGGDPMSFDYGHFTESGARTIIRLLHERGLLALPGKPHQ